MFLCFHVFFLIHLFLFFNISIFINSFKKYDLINVVSFHRLLFKTLHISGEELLKENNPQLKKILTPAKVNQNINMKLYYQGSEGNYLIFYDFKRDTIYLQYRIDRWDHEKNQIVKKLNRGLLYQVDFNYLGEVDLIPKSIFKNLERQKEKLPQTKKDEIKNNRNSNETGKGETTQEENPLNRKKRLSMGRFISFDYGYWGNLIY